MDIKELLANKKVIAAAVAVLGLSGAAVGAYAYGWVPGLESTSAEAPASNPDGTPASKPTQDKLVATVNGTSVNETEVAPLMAVGVDKAVAVDRYINKVLAAQLAEKEFSKEAEVALRAAQREVLSTLYMQKRSQQIAEAMSDQEIKSFYDKNVRDEDYKTFKVRFYLGKDPADGELALKALKNGEKDALSKLKYFNEQGEHFLPLVQLPYNLGQVVRTLKAGEFSQPIVLRNGTFVLNLEEIKDQKRPELEKVKAEIKNLLVNEKINNELTDKRKQAKIELK